jgi:hypothetical protein
MIETDNPFPLTGYHGAEHFCDRIEETDALIRNAMNGVNTTLLSLRRMGKTGLLFHFMETITRRRKAHCIYVDALSMQDLRAFTNTLAGAALKAFPEKKHFGKLLLEWVKSMRPVISFDPLTGSPEVQLDFRQPEQYEHTLAGLFAMLESQEKRIVVIIDEFQQTGSFPEPNIEAMLRTLIQPLKKTRFIFCGSDQHLMSEIFNNTKRPFFASTQLMHLTPIPDMVYGDFITQKFQKGKRKVSQDAVKEILRFTRTHTFYTQSLCNRLYSDGNRNIQLPLVQSTAHRMLAEQEPVYYQYRSLLTTAQWNLLRAIAIEDTVLKPLSKHFIMAHRLESASNVQRSLEALLTKEMVYKEQGEEGTRYRVYDCFLSRWLALKG